MLTMYTVRWVFRWKEQLLLTKKHADYPKPCQRSSPSSELFQNCNSWLWPSWLHLWKRSSSWCISAYSGSIGSVCWVIVCDDMMIWKPGNTSKRKNGRSLFDVELYLTVHAQILCLNFMKYYSSWLHVSSDQLSLFIDDYFIIRNCNELIYIYIYIYIYI